MRRVLYVTRSQRHWALSQKIIDGLYACGYEAIWTTFHAVRETAPLEGYEFAVFLGWSLPDGSVESFDRCRAAGLHVICISDGYLDRSADAKPRYSSGYWAMGLDGLNCYSTIPVRAMPDFRWRSLGISVAPWKTDGKVIVVAHQHRPDWRGDSRTNYFHEIMRVASLTGLPIRVRMHPNHWRGSDFPEFEGYDYEISIGRRHSNPIENDLKDAYCLITHDSNAALDAIINGVPAYTVGRSIIGEYGQPLTELDRPKYFDRAELLHWVAWQQYTAYEFANGYPIEYALRHIGKGDRESELLQTTGIENAAPIKNNQGESIECCRCCGAPLDVLGNGY